MSLFWAWRPKGCWIQHCCLKQTHHFIAPGSPLLWDGFTQKMPLSFHTGDYRVQAPMTLSMRDIVTKTYSSSTFVWKECKFLYLKRKRRGEISWKFGPFPSQFIPSPPSSLFLSPSCLVFSNVFLVVCPVAYKSQHAWSAYFSCPKTTPNKT